MTPNEAKADEKARMLIAYFRSIEIPDRVIRLNDWSKIVNNKTYIEININRLQNLPPLSTYWKIGYYALYDLKKILENENHST